MLNILLYLGGDANEVFYFTANLSSNIGPSIKKSNFQIESYLNIRRVLFAPRHNIITY